MKSARERRDIETEFLAAADRDIRECKNRLVCEEIGQQWGVGYDAVRKWLTNGLPERFDAMETLCFLVTVIEKTGGANLAGLVDQWRRSGARGGRLKTPDLEAADLVSAIGDLNLVVIASLSDGRVDDLEMASIKDRMEKAQKEMAEVGAAVARACAEGKVRDVAAKYGGGKGNGGGGGCAG